MPRHDERKWTIVTSPRLDLHPPVARNAGLGVQLPLISPIDESVSGQYDLDHGVHVRCREAALRSGRMTGGDHDVRDGTVSASKAYRGRRDRINACGDRSAERGSEFVGHVLMPRITTGRDVGIV
jgi:hypothetical protein